MLTAVQQRLRQNYDFTQLSQELLSFLIFEFPLLTCVCQHLLIKYCYKLTTSYTLDAFPVTRQNSIKILKVY